MLPALVWASAPAVGAAPVMRPKPATSIRASDGGTPTDFTAALHAGGSSTAIVGASDFTPRTGAARLPCLSNSLVGASVISPALSHLVQVYGAFRRRNALGVYASNRSIPRPSH